MTQIIGFCGEKQSGKDSACNLIIMLKLVENGVCKRARLNDHGDIEVSDIFGETVSPDLDWFSLTHPNVSATLLFNDQVHFCRKYSFAMLRNSSCMTAWVGPWPAANSPEYTTRWDRSPN